MKSARISSTRAAQILGVTVSTVKRWADEGELPCDRTAGGHRRFRAADLEAFRRARRGEAPPPRDLLTCLLDEATGRETVLKLLEVRGQTGSWIAAADELGAALEELGLRWEDGDISVLEEHIISTRLERALGWLADEFPRAPSRPHCLLLTPTLEDHSLGLMLAELCLREAGWRTTMVGRQTPLHAITPYLRAEEVDSVAISASSHYTDARALAAYYNGVVDAATRSGISVVLGGSGAWPDPPPYGHRIHRFSELGALLQPPSPLLAS